jgi:membrane fusion protein (multidrug efflux system)
MANDRTAYASEQEIAELRDEIRSLKEEQKRQRPAQSNGQHRDDEDQPAGGDDKSEKDNQPQEKKPNPRRKWIIIAAVILVTVIGIAWWLHARHFESTDDATVDGHTSGIASRISGTVVAVYVEENQFVKAGQVVVDLDPRDDQVALEQARAQLAQARNQTLSEEPNIPVTQVTNATEIASSKSTVSGAEAGVAAAEHNYDSAVDKVTEARANNAKAQADVERYRFLVEKDEISRQQFDQVVANAKALAATVAANQATALAALKQVDQSREQLAQARERAEQVEKNAPRQVEIRRANTASRESAAQAARAQVDQAELNLTYCKIATPVGGIVAKRLAEVGQHVAPGEQVLLVAQVDDLWITANFRETQLQSMHPGQSVRIHVDSLAADFDGYVESMPAASGAITSLLPPENATGNFVKIVQRLPVRIRFKNNQQGLERLRPGMSAEPKVTVR